VAVVAGCDGARPVDITPGNAALGIQPGSVPAYQLRPNGLMLNGLLPEQHANEL
jgi:hypothetical protein